MTSGLDEILRDGTRQYHLSLSEAQLVMFETYVYEILAWNKRVNLTGITTLEDIAVKHFLDSLSVVLVLPQTADRFSVIDVGSGAGFPGLPLKIALPNLQVTLLESTRKKTNFLQHMVKKLQLDQVTVLTARAEEAGQQQEYRECFHIAVARAVSSLTILLEYTLPFVRIGGRMIAQKGQYPSGEIAAARKAVKALGGEVSQVLPVKVPGLDADRHLVVIEKVKSTPGPYPRRPGIPAKQPL